MHRLPWRCSAWCSAIICTGILYSLCFFPLDFFPLHLNPGTILTAVLWNSFGKVIGQTYKLNLKFKLHFRIWEEKIFFFVCLLFLCFNPLSSIFICSVFWSFKLVYAFSQAFKHWLSKMEVLPTKGKFRVSARLHY